MIASTSRYGMGATVALEYQSAVDRVKEALGEAGFGILCEIDIAATMKKKLNVEFRPYVILGACNPVLAHRALTSEPDIGLLLPCNVIVYAAETPGRSVVAAIDPVTAMQISDNENLRQLAEDAKARLTRALEAVVRSAASP